MTLLNRTHLDHIVPSQSHIDSEVVRVAHCTEIKIVLDALPEDISHIALASRVVPNDARHLRADSGDTIEGTLWNTAHLGAVAADEMASWACVGIVAVAVAEDP